MATKLEAFDIIKHFGMKPLSDNAYSCADFNLYISGMGCINMASCVSKYLPDTTRAINLGFAGAISSKLKLYEFVQAQSCGKHLLSTQSTPKRALDFANNCFPLLNVGNQGFRLISVDVPLFDSTERDRLQPNYDLVDMEGYAFASVLKESGIDHEIHKIISDTAGKDGQGLDINPKELSKRLPVYLEQML